MVVLNNYRHSFCKINVRSVAVTRRFTAMCCGAGGGDGDGDGEEETRYILEASKR